MDKSYDFQDFTAIIKKLRAKDGCPWDRVQTHQSLRPCVMEEAAELIGAIRIYDQTGSAENMQEELGDLLLQVVMHSEIAEEEKLFTIKDVIQTVSEKMIRRHPHVFGTIQADTAEEVLDNWEDIKKKEKEGKDWIKSALREIPPELPSLTRAPKVLKKADKLYEKGSDYKTDLDSIKKAITRMEGLEPETYDRALTDCIGDILLAVSDISRQYKLSPEQILWDRIEEIIDRYEPLAKNQ